MNSSCPPAPLHKREYISDIGKILVKDYGKKKYYKPEEVKKSHNKSNWSDSLDFSCLAMSTYSSHSDFDRYHKGTGEICGNSEMKAKMLEGISLTDSFHLADFPDVDLDASWLDLGDVFEGVLEGIGEFFSAIGDSL